MTTKDEALDNDPERAMRGLQALRVVLSIDSPETRGWSPAVQQESRRAIDRALASIKRLLDAPQPEPVALEMRLVEIAKMLPEPQTLGWETGDMCEPDTAIKGYTKRQVLAVLAEHWDASPPAREPLTDEHALNAARYRWLRGGKARTTGLPKAGRIEVAQWEDRSEGSILKGAELDAAIDAAMKEKP